MGTAAGAWAGLPAAACIQKMCAGAFKVNKQVGTAAGAWAGVCRCEREGGKWLQQRARAIGKPGEDGLQTIKGGAGRCRPHEWQGHALEDAFVQGHLQACNGGGIPLVSLEQRQLRSFECSG
eukprot:1145769-Pelagomonas_calceolata.AAC.1